MADEEPGRYHAGLTSLVVTVPEAATVVSRWRERLDPGADVEVPAHVTVLYPFLREEEIDAGVTRTLSDLIGSYDAFDVWFGACARWPDEGVLYLEPTPEDQFRRLTKGVTDRWPETSPYGGRFGDDITPHLTIAQRDAAHALDAIEVDVRRLLPIATRVRKVALMVLEGSRWREQQAFSLR